MMTHAQVWVTSENPDHIPLVREWNIKTCRAALPLHDFPQIYRRYDVRKALWGVLLDVRKGGLEDVIVGQPQGKSVVVRSHARKVQQVMHIKRTPHQLALNEALGEELGGWSTDLLPSETKPSSPSLMLCVYASEALAKESEERLQKLWFMRGIEFATVEVVFSRPQ